MWRLHRHVGMGGDLYVEAVAGSEVEQHLGGELREAHGREFRPLRQECEPLDGARDLLVALRERGLRVVLASSSEQDDLDFFLDRLGAKELIDAYTTGDEVEQTKPEPDLVRAALAKAGSDDAVLVGDSPWDVESAHRAGIETVCVITGGFSEQELRDAGAVAVFDSLVSLRERLDETPVGCP